MNTHTHHGHTRAVSAIGLECRPNAISCVWLLLLYRSYCRNSKTKLCKQSVTNNHIHAYIVSVLRLFLFSFIPLIGIRISLALAFSPLSATAPIPSSNYCIEKVDGFYINVIWLKQMKNKRIINRSSRTMTYQLLLFYFLCLSFEIILFALELRG